MSNFDEAFGDLLPENCFAITGIRILSYLCDDGKTKYRFRWSGEAAITEMIGLLEMVKTELLSRALDPGSLD